MTRNIPIRTCIGCRKKEAKTSLVRFTFTVDSGIQLDKRQRMPGRGAYVCPDVACLEKAWKRRAFARALKISPSHQKILDTNTLNRLREEMEILVLEDKDRSKEGDVNEQT